MNDVKITSENDPRDYVGYDLMGFPYNRKYPPNKDKFGETFYGYPSKGIGVLLYDFCIMGYDIVFTYEGKTYYLMDAGEGVLTDKSFSERKEVFDSPMTLVENLKINGKPLLEIAPQITDIEPV